MRIATTQYQATMGRSLELNQTMVSRLTEQMATGNKISVPSDDPITNVRISRLNREEAIVSQYRENIGAVKIRLAKNETYLTGMVNDLGTVHDQMVWAADGSNTPDDLHAMVESLEALRDSILYSANTRDQEGKYIFSGTETTKQPIVLAGDGVSYTYAGNTKEQKVVVGNGITQAVNADVSGVEALLTNLNKTIEALRTTTTRSSEEPLKSMISGTMDTIQAGQDALAGRIAKFGGAQTVLGTLDSNHANVSLSNNTARHDLSALDYGVASTELAGYNMALQASYQSYSKISNLSLFNVL